MAWKSSADYGLGDPAQRRTARPGACKRLMRARRPRRVDTQVAERHARRIAARCVPGPRRGKASRRSSPSVSRAGGLRACSTRFSSPIAARSPAASSATCRRLGSRTVAVYSEADAAARHVRLADQAVRVGPAAARESYLRIERIIEAAQRSGAQAIHPGYGFLSENPLFAERCAAAGLVFIGPSVAAMRAMSSKAARQADHAALRRAAVAGVPRRGPGSRRGSAASRAHRLSGADQGQRRRRRQGHARGRARRRVRRSAGLLPARGAGSFSDARVLLEKYLLKSAPHRSPDLRRQPRTGACTCSSAIARRNGATRKCWRKPRRRT